MISSIYSTRATTRRRVADTIVLAMSTIVVVATPLHAQRSVPASRPDAPPTHPISAAPIAHDSAVAKGDNSDQITSAMREYHKTGVARTVIQGSFVTFPYGHSQPTVTCAVLRACVIELERGETLLSRIAGDTERWEIVPTVTGPNGGTVLVVVKPRECDITTNLVLATDRRVYDLTLDAPPCASTVLNPQHAYTRHVRFYYPDETVVTSPLATAPVATRGDPLSLDFHYRVKKDRKFPWTPAQVFDDGTRVYIKLPPEARTTEAPVLFALGADGSKVLINYNLVGGDTYVTDRLFDRAVLVSGADGTERTALIERVRGGGR